MTAARRSRWAALTRRAAWIAFAATLVLSPLRAQITLQTRSQAGIYSGYTDFLVSWGEIAALATLAFWATGLLLERRRVDLGPAFLRWPVIGLLAVVWLGVPFSVDASLAAVNAVHMTLLAALGVYVVNEVRGLQRLGTPLALMVATQAGLGIAQVIAQRSLGLGVLGERTLAPSLPVSVVTANDGTRILRAYGLTDHPNILGGVLGVGLLLLAGTVAARSARPSWWRAGIVVAGAVGLFLTFSRGAWLALVAGGAVFVVVLVGARERSGVRRVAAIGACGLVLGAPLVVPYQSALAARSDQSATNVTERRSIDERVALAQMTAHIVVAHPVLGTGVGTLPEAVRSTDPEFRYGGQPAHVVALVVAAETGLAGGALYLVVLVAPWLALWRVRSRWNVELGAASAALAALTVAGLFDYYTWSFPSGRIWAWTVLGLWIVAYRKATTGTRDVV